MYIQQYRDITTIAINEESKKENKQEWYQQNGEIGGSPLISLSATIIRKPSTDKTALWEISDPSWRLWNPLEPQTKDTYAQGVLATNLETTRFFSYLTRVTSTFLVEF